MGINPDVLIRFFQKFEVAPNGCWEWQAYKQNGYGYFGLNGTARLAHRYAAHIFKGFNLKSKNLICHNCDNPACVNPEHLYEGTYSSNNADREIRGRGAPQKGASNHNAKVDQVKVIKIRALHKKGMSFKAIGRKFNISDVQAGNICKFKSWGI